MTRSGAWGARWTDGHSFVLFAVLYAAASLLSRATVLSGPGGGISLILPAAGIAVLWLMQSRRPVLVVAAVGGELAVILLVTGASAALAAAATVATMVQTATIVALLRRWVPGALGTGGEGSIHSLPVLMRGTGSVALGCTSGALLGAIGLWANGSQSWTDVVLLFLRQFCGVMIVAPVGHLTWEHFTQPRRPRPQTSYVELAGLWLVTAVVYGWVFTSPLPTAFAVIPLTIWCAVRFSTYAAAIHATTFGSVAVVLTLLGRGDFSVIRDLPIAAIHAQGFTIVVLMTALVLGSVRDQRVDVLERLVRSEATAAARAGLLLAMNQAMDEGLMLVDASGTVLQANDSARAMLARLSGAGGPTTADYDLLRTDGSPLPPAELPSRRALIDGHLPTTDIILPLKDGTRRVATVTATRLPDGIDATSGPVALLVFRDVTAERAESRRLAEFAETTAHDLRSPLTTVRGWASMASTELTKDAPSISRANDLVTKAMTGVTRLGELIDEMLDHALAEGAELHLEPLELAGPDGLVDDLADLLAVPDLTVHAVRGHTVLGDERAVRQVFANLLGNAVKYADPARPLAVDVHVRRRGSRVLVEVTDNGRGIAEADRETVFDRFERSSSATAVVGTGIGLSVCRLVVERHGGTIRCTSGPGGIGTTFSFDLPAAEDDVPTGP
jgi:signal transduction histidine kinase